MFCLQLANIMEIWLILQTLLQKLDFPGGSDSKASAYNAGDLGSIPGSGRSLGEGNGNPLQYSCLENPMDIHGVAKSQTQLSNFTLKKLVHVTSNLLQFFLLSDLTANKCEANTWDSNPSTDPTWQTPGKCINILASCSLNRHYNSYGTLAPTQYLDIDDNSCAHKMVAGNWSVSPFLYGWHRQLKALTYNFR